MKQIVLSVLAAIVAAVVVVNMIPGPSSSPVVDSEPVFDRVMTTKTIRCAWLQYPPFIVKDIKTGELRGLTVDTMHAIGKVAGLKIEWAEEVSLVTAFEALKLKRVDMACIPFWPMPQRAAVADFTTPLYFDTLLPFVRSDDQRYQTYDDLNQPSVRVVIQEGQAGTTVLPLKLNQANVRYLPALSDPAMQLLDVMTNKADVALVEMALFRAFEQNHPSKLKMMTSEPFLTMPAVLWLPHHESRLKAMIDSSITSLHHNGTMNHLLDQYGGRKNFLYVAVPYQNIQP